MFEQSRYFFNYVLPDIITNNLYLINQFFSKNWWVFLLIAIIFFYLFMKFFRRYIYKRSMFRKFDEFLDKLSSIENIDEEEKFLLSEVNLMSAVYSAVYIKRGETYILIDSNAKKDVGVPLRFNKLELAKFKKSGRYNISYFINHTTNMLILFYSSKELQFEKCKGHLNMILTYYEKRLIVNRYSETQMAMENSSTSLMKLNMNKDEFFKFIVFLVKESTNAKGIKLLTKDGKEVFKLMDSDAPLQKIFYIRNTPYKLEYYNDKEMEFELVTHIGSFLDLLGAYIMNIDANSQMIQNYLELLKLTNSAIELKSPYYKNHSKIVQIVAVETAKSLFLGQEDIDNIAIASEIHDVGMVGNLEVILKEGKIDDKDVIKQHPLIGALMVEPINHIYDITDIIKYHHEKIDGTGYPFGVAGNDFPVNAQVLALAEFYAGITSDRSYRKGKTHEEALEEIKNLVGSFFEKTLVYGFLEVEKTIKIKIEKLKLGDKDENSDNNTNV
jgi:HD-GYP domain-containing protein (c-di-GMP phosphodiesterase class II)